MRAPLLITLCVLTVTTVHAYNLLLGDISRSILAKEESVKYNAIPFIKRVKYFFYSQPDNRPIKAIQALDNLHSHATINITAGGIGYSFVNLRMKSDRGSGLDYDIGIYVPAYYTV